MFDELCAAQSGVVTRRQALESGLTQGAIRSRLRAGKWRRLCPRVYWTFTGPPPRAAMLWAALLGAGHGAVLSHETAAELCGLLDEPAELIHVSIPPNRRIKASAGVRVHVRHNPPRAHPALEPARTNVEDTVVDLTQWAPDVDEAIAWIARACGKRLTTPERLSDAFRRRDRLRWREALLTAVSDVGSGCQSLLELRYLRDVERAHGLPAGTRQHRRTVNGSTTYSDVEYAAYGVGVELDGRVGHEGNGRLRDKRRDNRRAASGDRVLRYGWADVNIRPCGSAEQVAGALHAGGWTGEPVRCGAACMIATT